jgi:magnesium chelatase subunit I
MTISKTPTFHYPFVAVVGQHTLKTALLLAACDPLLGGVLISGNRGTAKSTLARSLADLLDDKAFINCPLGVTEDRLLGSLDVEYALAKGKLKFSPGLFAKAHGGVLYVDEINLLPDHLVDLLLDVSASGINYLERDGVSHQHKAQFILIGSMNPEEGALRPQLLDRFGLSVEMNQNPDLEQRLKIVASRLRFDNDPADFCTQYITQQHAVKQQLQQATKTLPQVTVNDACKLEIAQRCLQAGVEGVRADLALFRAARAHAALHDCAYVDTNNIDAVTDLVLAHRQQENDQYSPQVPQSESIQIQQPNSSQTDALQGDSNDKSQGDWGEMPMENVAIGLKRQLDPTKFSQHHPPLTQKKKI